MKIKLFCPICGSYEGITKEENSTDYFCNNCKEYFSRDKILSSNQKVIQKIAEKKVMEIIKNLKLGG